jgi:uncharacterized protein (TIGR02453 family)
LEPFGGWPPEALEWFRELEQNNNREWFQAHRSTYDDAVRGPLEALLEELRDEFGDAKVTRPNRDIRFSPDKRPYKNNIYAVVAHPSGGGWYVGLFKDGLFSGGGMHAPDPRQLAALRTAIAAEDTGSRLEEVIAHLESEGLEVIEEGALKTAPRGYPADHPRVRLLRLRNLAAGRRLEPGPWLHTAEAKDRVVHAWRAVTPLLDWIHTARVWS